MGNPHKVAIVEKLRALADQLEALPDDVEVTLTVDRSVEQKPGTPEDGFVHLQAGRQMRAELVIDPAWTD